MKCPQCGTTNGKTNRFCRGCGLKLEGLPQTEEQPQQPQVECAPDEVALGEELFAIWQDYSAGSLDTALVKAQKVIGCAPESASAHNILALIYERKAERELAGGEVESAHDFLKLAIAEYEKIIDLNPNSAADREKLSSLRMLLAGQGAPPPPPTAKHIFDLKAAFNAVPKPVLAGVGAMLMLMILGIVFLVPAGSEDKRVQSSSRVSEDTGSGRIESISTPGVSRGGSNGSQSNGSGGPSVYTFSEAAPRGTAGGLTPPKPPSAAPRITIPNEPAKLPPLTGIQVSVVPESKGSDGAGKPAASQPKPEKTADSGKGSITIAPAEASQPSQAQDGASTLARAIELKNQGKTSEAIAAAQQAIGQFQADVDAGRNVTASKRGAENARKLIQLWQQSSATQ